MILALAGLCAAAEPGLERLDVWVWPEHDRPEALIMVEATLPADQPLPAVVRLPIPQEAGAPWAVAARSPADGQLYVAEHTDLVEGGWLMVDVVAPWPVVRVEYYAPIEVSGPERALSWRWPGGLPVGAVEWEVRAPDGATGLVVVPDRGATRTDAAEPLRVRGLLGPLAAADPVALGVRYARAAAAPPVPAPAPAPAAPPAERPPRSGWLTAILAAAALAVIALPRLLNKRPR